MSHSEWDLLCIAEDIEPGDTLEIQHIKDTNLMRLMVFCSVSEDEEWILCRDQEGSMEFNVHSLDQKGKRTKRWRVVRKSPHSTLLLPRGNYQSASSCGMVA